MKVDVQGVGGSQMMGCGLPLYLDVKPGPLLELFGFDAIMPQTRTEDWLERLTSPADCGQSKQGESDGKV